MMRWIWLAALAAAACSGGGDDSYHVPTHSDAPRDTPADAAPDAPPDAPPDAMIDAEPDAPPDAMIDAMPDAMLPDLYFTPPSLDFGTVYPSNAQRVITLVNPRTTSVPITSTDITSQFSIVLNGCTPSIPAMSQCDITVQLTATSGGPDNGTLTVHAGGLAPMDVHAAVTAVLGMEVDVSIGGAGTGSVSSSPAGISCPLGCSDVFSSGVTLTAAPAPGSVLSDWGYAGCPMPTPSCTIPFATGDVQLAPTFAISSDSVTVLTFAGNVPGEVSVRDTNGQLVTTCTNSCTFHSIANVGLILYGSTTQVFGGFSGACTSTAPIAHCNLNATVGAHDVTATFTSDPRVLFTRVSTEPFTAVAFDGSGNLFAATTSNLYKYTSTGTLTWTKPITGIVALAATPTAGVNLVAGTTLRGLDAGGTTVWSSTLDSMLQGCSTATRFPRCLATSPDGTIAVGGPHGFGRYTSAGALGWKVLQTESEYSVAIDSSDDVYVVDDYTTASVLDIRRFTGAAGTEVLSGMAPNTTPWIVGASVNSIGTIALGPSTQIWATSATSATPSAELRSYTLDGSGGVSTNQTIVGGIPTPRPAVSLTATGGSWYVPSVDYGTACTFTLSSVANANPDVRSALDGNDPVVPEGYFGFAPNDMAVDAQGHTALAGAYNGATFSGGVLQVFSP
ncbi:MAG TPA: hypothetical protein VGM88_12455 [Kofleriaceae bacterium]